MGRPPRAALLAVTILISTLLLSLAGAGSAHANPILVGKTVAPGVLGTPFGNTTGASFPSLPATEELLVDGNLVYDTKIGAEVYDAGDQPALVRVVTEEWTPGTETVVVNTTLPNGSYALVPQQEPARLDPLWTYANLSVAPGTGASLAVYLQPSYTARPLEIWIGSADWVLTLETPTTTSVAGVYTSLGILGFGFLMSGVTATSIVVAMFFARRLAERVLRTPPVRKWWIVLWVVPPLMFFVLDYVPFNQSIGVASPYIFPVAITGAVFPYLPRLWRSYETSEFEGVRPVNLEQATNSKHIVYTTMARGGLRCAPETWAEFFWVLMGHPLPSVRGRTVDLLGRKVEVIPRGMAVSCEMGPFYEAEATMAYWFDARVGMKRVRTHLEWWRYETVPVLGPDALAKIGERKKRRFSPHVVDGYLEGQFPPKRPVAEEIARVRFAEVESHDNEADRLLVAELLGTVRHMEREYAARTLATYDESNQRRSQPRTREEIRRLIEHSRKVPGGKKTESEGETED